MVILRVRNSEHSVLKEHIVNNVYVYKNYNVENCGKVLKLSIVNIIIFKYDC